MKKLMVMCVAAMAVACAKSDKFTIEGNVENLSGSVVLVDDNDNMIDSTTVTNGKFSLKGSAPQPMMGYILTPHGALLNLFIEPGTILVKGSVEIADQISATGTPANDIYTAFRAEGNRFTSAFRDHSLTEAQREALSRSYDSLTDCLLNNNMDNIVGLFALSHLAAEMSSPQITELLKKFPKSLSNNIYAQRIRKTAERFSSQEQFTPVTAPDLSGKELSLGDYVGKGYVLLDFWASWCRPCMNEMPALKSAYDKYHKDGFEIFAVSLDEDRKAWSDVAKGLPWVNVSECRGWDVDAVRDYNVQSIPNNCLIAPDGTIVARNLRGEALSAKLAELLGK